MISTPRSAAPNVSGEGSSTVSTELPKTLPKVSRDSSTLRSSVLSRSGRSAATGVNIFVATRRWFGAPPVSAMRSTKPSTTTTCTMPPATVCAGSTACDRT